ncbi:18832_t:CDS:2 [Funneliformis geosporum]|nr:18832_t:CDS:2 [Funneliformis geosporum]
MNINEYFFRLLAKLRYLVGINDDISVFLPTSSHKVSMRASFEHGSSIVRPID